MIPDADTVLSLEPEELAGVLLRYMTSSSRNVLFNRHDYGLPNHVDGYPRNKKDEVSKALMEAWMWLEKEGMVAPAPGQSGGWFFISRKGMKLKQPADFENYRRSNILPRDLLHPTTLQKVWSPFIRGEYDTAVFNAFKEVEILVREKGLFEPKDIGVNLMRKAFGRDGLFTNQEADLGEQQALSDLFAGSIGSYKNPHSHRNVEISIEEAVEMIILASHLLKIVESRDPNIAVEE